MGGLSELGGETAPRTTGEAPRVAEVAVTERPLSDAERERIAIDAADTPARTAELRQEVEKRTEEDVAAMEALRASLDVSLAKMKADIDALEGTVDTNPLVIRTKLQAKVDEARAGIPALDSEIEALLVESDTLRDDGKLTDAKEKIEKAKDKIITALKEALIKDENEQYLSEASQAALTKLRRTADGLIRKSKSDFETRIAALDTLISTSLATPVAEAEDTGPLQQSGDTSTDTTTAQRGAPSQGEVTPPRTDTSHESSPEDAEKRKTRMAELTKKVEESIEVQIGLAEKGRDDLKPLVQDLLDSVGTNDRGTDKEWVRGQAILMNGALETIGTYITELQKVSSFAKNGQYTEAKDTFTKARRDVMKATEIFRKSEPEEEELASEKSRTAFKAIHARMSELDTMPVPSNYVSPVDSPDGNPSPLDELISLKEHDAPPPAPTTTPPAATDTATTTPAEGAAAGTTETAETGMDAPTMKEAIATMYEALQSGDWAKMLGAALGMLAAIAGIFGGAQNPDGTTNWGKVLKFAQEFTGEGGESFEDAAKLFAHFGIEGDQMTTIEDITLGNLLAFTENPASPKGDLTPAEREALLLYKSENPKEYTNLVEEVFTLNGGKDFTKAKDDNAKTSLLAFMSERLTDWQTA